jgi:hypothetical protein
MKKVFLTWPSTVIILFALAGCSQQNRKPAALSIPQMPKSPIGFVKGFSWGTFGKKGEYTGPKAAESMKLLTETNSNWVCVSFNVEMKTPNSTEILWDKTSPDFASDDEIRNAINLAKENSLKVILKPTVNCDDGTWRSFIEFKTPAGKKDYAKWKIWWANYDKCMLHYAKLAQETKCDLLCLGCEMGSTEPFEKNWRSLIARVREVYTGPLTYDTNHGQETKITWWDAVDIIGISAYYPVGTDDTEAALAGERDKLKTDTTLEGMLAKWTPIRERLRAVSLKWNRPIFFIEIGVRSAKGAAATPWEHENEWPYDGGEQARFYQAAFESFWNEPWFIGYAWWAWPAHLYPEERGVGNIGFCVYGKPAEEVVKNWYGRKR